MFGIACTDGNHPAPNIDIILRQRPQLQGSKSRMKGCARQRSQLEATAGEPTGFIILVQVPGAGVLLQYEQIRLMGFATAFPNRLLWKTGASGSPARDESSPRWRRPPFVGACSARWPVA
jgi:hypothetical protein